MVTVGNYSLSLVVILIYLSMVCEHFKVYYDDLVKYLPLLARVSV